MKIKNIASSILKLAKSYTVYHGTNGSFKTFNKDYLGTTSGKTPTNLSGFFFSDDIEVAKSFGKNLITAIVTLNNPVVLNANGKDYSAFKHRLNDIVDRTDKSKKDGIIIKNYVDSGIEKDIEKPATQFLVFDPKNIKII